MSGSENLEGYIGDGRFNITCHYGCDDIMCPIESLLSSTGGEGVSVDCDQDYCDKIR